MGREHVVVGGARRALELEGGAHQAGLWNGQGRDCFTFRALVFFVAVGFVSGRMRVLRGCSRLDV